MKSECSKREGNSRKSSRVIIIRLTGHPQLAAIIEAVRAVGAEDCIVSANHGQAHSPLPVEGLQVMLACGLNEKEVENMVKANPARLLDLS